MQIIIDEASFYSKTNEKMSINSIIKYFNVFNNKNSKIIFVLNDRKYYFSSDGSLIKHVSINNDILLKRKKICGNCKENCLIQDLNYECKINKWQSYNKNEKIQLYCSGIIHGNDKSITINNSEIGINKNKYMIVNDLILEGNVYEIENELNIIMKSDDPIEYDGMSIYIINNNKIVYHDFILPNNHLNINLLSLNLRVHSI